MKRRIFLSIIIFFFFVLVFFLQKIIFILAQGSVNGGVNVAEALQILWHGLSLDMSMSGYLSVIPFLLLVASVWSRPELPEKIFTIYFSVVLFIISVVTFVDVVVYSHWGFHLDSTVMLYMQNPKEVVASGSVTEWLTGSLGAVLFLTILYLGYIYLIRNMLRKLTFARNRWLTGLVLVVLTGLLFLPIRGGVTVSTMNIGHAYFSDRMFLNHAAINPLFNFMYSLGKYDDFASQYQFYDKEEAVRVFNRLQTQPASDSLPRLLHTDRPNIILFLLESFSYDVALDSVIAPNMHRLAKEGVLFENFYANGFRTDRGLVSVLSGYPSHPTAAILKYPKKTETLATIPKSLRMAGYEEQSMYYGGDIKFANMRSYIVGACGIQDIISDQDFPIGERLTKWGVPDRPLFDRVRRELTETSSELRKEATIADPAGQQPVSKQTPEAPFLKVILTLSSHEPFDVPVTTFDEPYLNSVHYTDECIGDFVSALRQTDLWDHTLLVFVADHAMQGYPQGPDNYDKVRFHIPMIWAGGAVAQPTVVSDYGSQNDLAATLLSQLGVDYSGFEFSKDLLNPAGRKFSFYSYVNGFCLMDTSGVYLYDNNQQKALSQTGNPALEKEAKSFFQVMYLDFGKR